MLLLSYFLLALVAYLFGYYWRDVHDRMDWIVKLIMAHAFKHPDHNKQPEKDTSMVIEPSEDDPVAQARREFDETQRRLNK